MLSNHNSAVDLSDPGVGKTFVASAVASASRLPTLVVCPKIVVTAWERAAEHFGDSFSVLGYEKLRTGRTPFAQWDNTPPTGFERERFFVCQCCQRRVDFDDYFPCYCHPAGIHCLIEQANSWRYGKFNFAPEVRQIIFDEVHRCNGLDSLNADMLIAAKRQRLKILGLSATLAETPLQFRALGYALDLHRLDQHPSFTSWAYRHSCKHILGAGLKWLAGEESQRKIMAGIRSEIIPARGVRVSVDDIPDFPESEISAELYDLSESQGIIDRLYQEMAQALHALEQRRSLDKCPTHPMTVILRARQQIELLKVPIAIELANDARAKGFSVVFFVNFRQTLDAIKLKRGIRGFIDGSAEGVARRQHWIDQFQLNRERELIANSEAGGVSVDLHDLHGSFPRLGLVFPGFSARILQQVFGRLRRDGGKSKSWYKVLLAAGTVEDKVYKKLRSKLNNLDALNDSDLMPVNLPLTSVSLLNTF